MAIKRRAGAPLAATLRALAAWMRHVRGGGAVNDPLAVPLAVAWRTAGTAGIVDALLRPAA